jgi:hypothetical protein
MPLAAFVARSRGLEESMHLIKNILLVVAAVGLMVAPAGAALIGVGGPNSSFEVPPMIIPAPANALDDNVTNKGM